MMNDIIKNSIEGSIATKKIVLEKCYNDIDASAKTIANAFKNGNKLLLCGNGGSAADSQHIAAELVVRLRSSVNRTALPALALTVDPSVMTAGSNDYGFDKVFARQVEAFGKKGDVFIAISTSGNSENVINAVAQAKENGMTVIGLLGKDGGKLAPMCDISVIVPSENTARIQESHIMIGHIWCETAEEMLFFEK